MARIKLAYIGGASTRAPGTVASLIDRGRHFAGSEVVLVDLDADRLEIVRRLAERLARASSVDLRITATTDRRDALRDCDAVLTSFRPGGFEARALDERIPLRYGVIGQETQGPGGFFMALRTINVMRDIVEEMERIAPKAWLFNYTNPINIVGQAVSSHSSIQSVSLCEGPIIFPRMLAKAAGLDPERIDAVMVGLNHASWSVRHSYDGGDLIAAVSAVADSRLRDSELSNLDRRLLTLATTMGSIPASYFQYYYFKDEVLSEMRSSPTTRAEDILAHVPDYWRHYREQAESDRPCLDPRRSRGGLHELELAIDVMDAVFNDRGDTWPVNVRNDGALDDFDADVVVEARGTVTRAGIRPHHDGRLPRQVVGLLKMLAEFQVLTAEAAWQGTRRDAIRALASNPLCFSLPTVEAMYDEMAAAHRAYLPARLLS